MKRYFESKRIKEVTKCTTVNQMRKAVNKLLSETADISILESENSEDYCVTIFTDKGLKESMKHYESE